MLRTVGLALTLLLVQTVGALAQTPTKVTIDELSAPASPAFVVLGVSPANVERPETPKAFTLNLLDKLQTSNGLPKNYALEVAPYWLVSHPNLQFGDYQNPDLKHSILQTLAISVGTAPIPGATDTADPLGTKIGLGVRTAIKNGHANPRLKRKLAEIIAKIEPIDDLVFDLMNREDELLAALKTNPDDEKSKQELVALQKSISEARASTVALALQIQQLDAERVGFFLNVAAGQVWTAFADDVRNAKSEKRGFWVTPSYRWRGCGEKQECESSIDAIAVVRALKDPSKDAVWDFGGRVVWKATKEFNVSLETLQRRQPDDAVDEEDSNRTVGLLEYRIRQDLILFGSFGQDFREATGAKPLVSFLGLNLGFGKKAVVGGNLEKTTK
jgi:hypothetical protein